jgi:hypothetical protein
MKTEIKTKNYKYQFVFNEAEPPPRLDAETISARAYNIQLFDVNDAKNNKK